MTFGFRDATTFKGRASGGTFEQGGLPDEEKERLCRSLLAEFGVSSVKATNKGELIHCCSLPDHVDHNPSASLNYKKLTYNCFSCGSSGGLLWYIATCREEADTDDARRWLQEQTGTGPDEQSLSSLLDFFEAQYGPATDNHAPIPKMSRRVLDPLMVIHPYMTDPRPDGRGIPEATLVHFLVGYGELPIRVGDYMVQSHRIVIPHIWKGDLVGWQSRRIIDDGTPKYQSTPDMPKDRTVYNYDPTAEVAVVVESPMSVLSKFHWEDAEGIHIEATFGAEVNERQWRQLSVHRRVILFFDNDDAGWKATESGIDALSGYSEVFVAPSVWAADPADFDDVTYLQLVTEAIPAPLWTRPEELLPWE